MCKRDPHRLFGAGKTGLLVGSRRYSNARSNGALGNPRFDRIQQNIYRYKKNGILYGVFRVGGKVRWRSLKTQKLREAKRQLATEMDRAEKTADAIKADMTLDELFKLYDINLSAVAPKTQKCRRSILKILRESWSYGLGLKIAKITVAHLKSWIALHSARVKAVTIREYLIVLRGMFDLAVDARAIIDSPVNHLKSPRIDKPIRTTPLWSQAIRIIAAVRSEKRNACAQESADLLEFMLRAGIGLAEAQNLLGQHVSFETGSITLFRQKTKTGFTIPIYPQLLPLLKRLRRAGKIKNDAPLFSIKSPRKALGAACARLGLPHFSIRALRRCFITKAIENGVDFKTLSNWQGHKDGGALIARVYSHLRSEHSKRMAKLLK